MSSTGELKQCNVRVIHFKKNYKIMLKAVTPVEANVFKGGIVLPS